MRWGLWFYHVWTVVGRGGRLPMMVGVACACAFSPTLSACQEVARTELLPASDRSIQVTSTLLYRLGGVHGQGWEAFERIRSLAFDGGGRLHLFDQGAQQVHVVSPEGQWVRSIGRQGGGPGEFTAATRMAVAPDGTVAVADLGRRTLALFAPDGEYLENIRLDGSNGRISEFFLEDRSSVVGGTSVGWMGRTGSAELVLRIPDAGGGMENPTGRPILRASVDGSPSETLMMSWVPRRQADNGRPIDVFFLPSAHLTSLPGRRGLAVVDSVDYRVRVVGQEENLILSREVSIRAPMEQERAQALIELVDRRAAGGVGGGVAGVGSSPEEAVRARDSQRRALLRRLRSSSETYPEMQVIQDLKADFDGRLWIERVGEDAFRDGPIDLVHLDDGYVGTISEGDIEMPTALGPSGLAVWLTEDEFGVPVVVVRRLQVPSGD